MCGIAALLLHPEPRSEFQWNSIRKLFTRNLLSNEERGREATGCAVLQQDGRIYLQKTPAPASVFVKRSGYQVLMERIDECTTLVLGHTRQPTKGNPVFNLNNHPLNAGPIFGVHNGQINNDDDLFESFGCPRSAEVDSEIIFRLLESLPFTPDAGEYLENARSVLQRLDGQFTILASDQRYPQRLLVLKHGNPLFVHFLPELNALVFSSRFLFLRKTFGRSVNMDSLPCDQLMIFETPAFPGMGIHPILSLSFS